MELVSWDANAINAVAIYIPHCSDGTMKNNTGIISQAIFISHIVQMELFNFHCLL